MKLEDFYNSEYFQYWDNDNRSTYSCGIIMQDPERFERIYDAADYGAEGSTHAEIIRDWIDALNTLSVMDPEFDEPEDCFTDLDKGQITQSDFDAIMKEINECYKWHDKNGSLHDEVG